MSIYGFYSWNRETTSTTLHCCSCSWATQLLVVDRERKSEELWKRTGQPVCFLRKHLYWFNSRFVFRIWNKIKKTTWDDTRNRENCWCCSLPNWNSINSGMLLSCFHFGLWSICNRRFQYGTWRRCCGCHRVHLLTWQEQQASIFCWLSSRFQMLTLTDSIPKIGSTASSALVIAG